MPLINVAHGSGSSNVTIVLPYKGTTCNGALPTGHKSTNFHLCIMAKIIIRFIYFLTFISHTTIDALKIRIVFMNHELIIFQILSSTPHLQITPKYY